MLCRVPDLIFCVTRLAEIEDMGLYSASGARQLNLGENSVQKIKPVSYTHLDVYKRQR